MLMIPLLSLVEVPSAASMFVSAGEYSVALFSELLWVVLAVTGLVFGGMFLKYVINRGLKGGVKTLIGGGRRGGRRGMRR